MNRYKIAYAYPSSANATKLGMGETGAYYLQGQTKLENDEWSIPFIVPGTEGEASTNKHDPDLLQLLKEWTNE